MPEVARTLAVFMRCCSARSGRVRVGPGACIRHDDLIRCGLLIGHGSSGGHSARGSLTHAVPDRPGERSRPGLPVSVPASDALGVWPFAVSDHTCAEADVLRRPIPACRMHLVATPMFFVGGSSLWRSAGRLAGTEMRSARHATCLSRPRGDDQTQHLARLSGSCHTGASAVTQSRGFTEKAIRLLRRRSCLGLCLFQVCGHAIRASLWKRRHKVRRSPVSCFQRLSAHGHCARPTAVIRTPRTPCVAAGACQEKLPFSVLMRPTPCHTSRTPLHWPDLEARQPV